jgi:small-conductance mechanosensitive channel
MRRLLPTLFVLILSLLARAQTLPATAPAAASQPATTQSTQPAATQPASQPASQPTPPPAQTQPAATLPAGPSIPLAEIVTQSESTLGAVRTTTAQLTGDPLVATVANELPPLTRDIDARLEDPANDLSANPSLDTLRAAEAAWNTFAANTDVWKRDLTRRVAAIDNTLGDLQTRIDTWNNTLTRANANRVPPEIIGRINTTLAALNDAHRQADAARANVLRLQALVAAQDARIAAALAEVARARDEALSHLFVQDSPPVWSTQVRPQAVAAATQPQDTFTKQRIALEIYFQQHSGRFLAHAFILALLTAALFWARRRFDTWVKDEPTLSPAAPVFASPLATAILLSVFLSIWLHPQAPRLFWAISGALTIIPAILLISRLTEPRLHRLLYVLVLFYFLDQLRAVIAGLYVWPRYFLLAETLAAVAFLVHFLFARLHAPPPPPPSPAAPGAGPSVSAAPTLSRSARRRQTGLRLVLQFALLLCLASALVNLLGFLALATFIAHALFRAAYIALIFYAGISVLDGLVIVTLHIRPVHRLAAVKNHATTIRARTRRFLGWAFFLLWLYILLNILNLRAPVLNQLHFLLTTPFGLGPVTLGDILKGILTVWAAFAISRFIRFLLQEDVYPHVRLPRGLGAAFSSVIHYVILLFGFITALAFLGFPLSQLTILTGAFGVGLGFGLQTIINNFFSGLIVLFERPVQVGDVIEMDGLIGSITRIGIRASIIRTQAGSDIIMPNSRLVAEKVINWSLTDRCRGFEIPLVIDGAADTSRVIQILQDTAKKVPHIAANPAPVAQFTAFAGPNLRFTLRAWTSEVENWLQIQSNLGLALTAALTTEKIPLK